MEALKTFFGLKQVLKQVRDELDDHFTAINENTDEIQSNYSYLQELENKLEQLTERIARIEVILEGQQKRFQIQPLSSHEKQVFLTLYTEEVPLTYADIARRTCIEEALVKHHIASLIEKGIPLIKTYLNATPFLKLDTQFKEVQAKENVLNLSLKSFVE